jgi:hypothetical protein
MRTILIAFAAIAATALAGCGMGGPDRVDASGPTISYQVNSQRELSQAAERADEWCYENYRTRARLIENGDAYNRNVVTFECT